MDRRAHFTGLILVVAGCHRDVISALKPDWLFDTAAQQCTYYEHHAPKATQSREGRVLDETTKHHQSVTAAFAAGVHTAFGVAPDVSNGKAAPRLAGPTTVAIPVPIVKLRLSRCEQYHWKHFRHHHYKTPVLSTAARTFLLETDGGDNDDPGAQPFAGRRQPVGMVATIRHNGPREGVAGAMPHRAHRTVVLPQWQGFGIGSRLSDAVAELHRREGSR